MNAIRVVTNVADCDDVIANGNKVPSALLPAASVSIGQTVGGSPMVGGMLYTDSGGLLAQDAMGPVWHPAVPCLSMGNAVSPFGLVYISHDPSHGRALVIQNNTGVFTNPTGIRIFGGATVFFEVSAGNTYIRSQGSGDTLNLGINNRTNIAMVGSGTGKVWIGDATAGTTITAGAQLEIDPLSTTTIGLIVQAQSGQTAPLIQLWGVTTGSPANRPQATINSAWATAADGTRKGRLTLGAEDSTGTSREGFRVESDGTQSLVGLNGSAAVAKGVITGSRGGNAALASLLTFLASRGDITDSTS